MVKNYTIKEKKIEILFNNEGKNLINKSSGSLVYAFFKGKFVMSWHPMRRGWEIPAGRRKNDETAEDCAKREVFEETGAITNKLVPLGVYTVNKNKNKKIIAVYTADIEKFETKPDWSETGIVKLFDELPDKLSYNDLIYENILHHIATEGLD